MIINNSAASSASASAAAAVGGFGRRRKRQSAMVHLVLLFCTAGIGNVFYAMYVSKWNSDRGL
ncbi:hypothetical protein GTY85_07980 [Streptomyces sp. SID8377]|nr:hypothetical protein [Streptomyces sp. SID8377]